MSSPSWNPADLETLQRLWPKGYTATEICIAIENRYSRNAVLGMANRLVRRGLLEPREANNHEWRARVKASPHILKMKPRLSQPYPFKAPVVQKTEAVDIRLISNEPAPIGPAGDFPGPDACRWPIGDPKTGDWRCCGHEAQDGPYCPHHASRAYQKPHAARS